MGFFKPTAGKIFLAFFLSLNIFFIDFLLSFYGLRSIITGYYDLYPGVVFLFLLATLLLSYFATSIFTIKLPQIWQPTLLKILLALFFELLLYSTGYILKIYALILALDMKDIGIPQGGVNPCPDLPDKFVNQCSQVIGFRPFILILIVVSLITVVLSYTLSCIVVFLACKQKKLQ